MAAPGRHEGRKRAAPPVTRPQTGKQWTDSDQAHDERGPKGRPSGGTRPVPLPPEPMTVLSARQVGFASPTHRGSVADRGGAAAALGWHRKCNAE